jgi:hypothetical protein
MDNSKLEVEWIVAGKRFEEGLAFRLLNTEEKIGF